VNQSVRPIHWILLVLSLLFQVTAVILGKTAALRIGTPTPVAFLTNGWYVGGLGCLLLQTVCWQVVLRGMHLTVAYLVASLNYLLILGASRIFFSERINAFNLGGSAAIIVGVFLVIRENQS
jgi:undecaprenyl phosphate-alpha-L-ara4N flippase subunit ArnE